MRRFFYRIIHGEIVALNKFWGGPFLKTFLYVFQVGTHCRKIRGDPFGDGAKLYTHVCTGFQTLGTCCKYTCDAEGLLCGKYDPHRHEQSELRLHLGLTEQKRHLLLGIVE